MEFKASEIINVIARLKSELTTATRAEQRELRSTIRYFESELLRIGKRSEISEVEALDCAIA